MAVSGDFMRLHLLQDRLRAAGAGQARRAMITELADETQKQVIEGFNRKRDPYGKAWAPAKKPPDWAIRAFGLVNHPLLDKTGRMIDTLRSRAIEIGVRITAPFYAAFHEQGTRSMPARMLFPRPDLGLGPIWGDAFLRASGRVARAFMGVV